MSARLDVLVAVRAVRRVHPAGTAFDGYSTTGHLAAFLKVFLDRNNVEGVRDATMWAFEHFCLLRGDNVRFLELTDAALYRREINGRDATIFSFQICRSKTNKYGKVMHTGFIRNRDASICPVFLLALYFFVL